MFTDMQLIVAIIGSLLIYLYGYLVGRFVERKKWTNGELDIPKWARRLFDV